MENSGENNYGVDDLYYEEQAYYNERRTAQPFMTCIENYMETIKYLRSLGFQIVVEDWWESPRTGNKLPFFVLYWPEKGLVWCSDGFEHAFEDGSGDNSISVNAGHLIYNVIIPKGGYTHIVLSSGSSFKNHDPKYKDYMGYAGYHDGRIDPKTLVKNMEKRGYIFLTKWEKNSADTTAFFHNRKIGYQGNMDDRFKEVNTNHKRIVELLPNSFPMKNFFK